ncbi:MULTISPECIES: hypothetical protein [unclassified Streptomyces]|uniref:hypothetical protein n=1 Tax=unclassified Streptomyces TaxID=2593676 RepID=UPI0037F12846
MSGRDRDGPGHEQEEGRVLDYVREFNTALAPWRREPTVREFIHRIRSELGITA